MTKFSFAQGSNCPPNLDFESGSFEHWECFTGNVSLTAGRNVMTFSPSAPIANRHTIYGPSTTEVDTYGSFPVRCPNGSGYSVKLGNNGTQRQAERISYTFTIPAEQNDYSIVYQYAVVFQNPNHTAPEQPKFTAKVYDVAANNYISCASFEFVATSSIPGFEQPYVNSNVWFKPWTAVTINLSGYAGKTVRLEFTTADCTQGAHFGYAYIDVNTGCNPAITGASFCPSSENLTLQAPFGYQQYTWYNQSLTRQVGSGSTLTLSPVPSAATVYALDVIPYPGMGCRDTIYTTVTPSPAPPANAGADKLVCNNEQIRIGTAAVAGYAYSWFPTAGLSDPHSANPTASPSVTTEYTLTVTNVSTGCSAQDKVTITVQPPLSGTISSSAPVICEGSSVTLTASGATNYQWFRDGMNISQPASSFAVTTPGTYTVQLINGACKNFADTAIVLNTVGKPVADFTFDKYCIGSPTVFTNKSSAGGSTMRWVWTIDNNITTEHSPVVLFSEAKQYEAKLSVSPEACPQLISSVTKTIVVEAPLPGINYLPKNAVDSKGLQLQAREIGISYEWQPASYLSHSRTAAPLYTGAHEQSYRISITRPSGCVTVDTQLVRLFKEREVYVPKAFTPNNDGQNDRMYPFLVGIKELKIFRIMNRWGLVVYEARTDLPGWDGTYKGARQPMDGYVWEAQAVDVDGNTITRKGSFTLIR